MRFLIDFQFFVIVGRSIFLETLCILIVAQPEDGRESGNLAGMKYTNAESLATTLSVRFSGGEFVEQKRNHR
jgi:hypothetical protein